MHPMEFYNLSCLTVSLRFLLAVLSGHLLVRGSSYSGGQPTGGYPSSNGGGYSSGGGGWGGGGGGGGGGFGGGGFGGFGGNGLAWLVPGGYGSETMTVNGLPPPGLMGGMGSFGGYTGSLLGGLGLGGLLGGLGGAYGSGSGGNFWPGTSNGYGSPVLVRRKASDPDLNIIQKAY